MDEQKLTYEQFKEDILQWKNTHPLLAPDDKR